MAVQQEEPPEDGSTDAIARNAVRVIVQTLFAPFDRSKGGNGGWWIASGKGYRFRGPVRSRREDEGAIETVMPRAAGWRYDRLSTLPDAGVLDKNPDWVCEVEDPWGAYKSTLELHEAAGVPYAWTIDPFAMTLAVYIRRRAAWSQPDVYRAPNRVRIPPFEGIEIDLSTFWKL